MTFLLGSTLKVSIVVCRGPGRRGPAAQSIGRRAPLGARGGDALRDGHARIGVGRAGVGNRALPFRACHRSSSNRGTINRARRGDE